MTEIDKEADRFCGILLKELGDLNPRLSKQLTKRVDQSKAKTENKTARKAAKISIYYTEYSELYEEAAKKVRRLPEFVSPPSNPKISTFFENIYLLYFRQPTPGSIESKYEKQY